MIKKGSVLIFALWILIILSMFTASMGIGAFLQVKKTKFSIGRRRCFYLALSGIKYGRSLLKDDSEKDEDEGKNIDILNEEWAKRFKKEVSFNSPPVRGTLQVAIMDETSKINLNLENLTVLKDVLNRLFKDADIDIEDAEEKIDTLLDYRDTDSDESEDSQDDAEEEENAKNEPLATTEEILLVIAFKPGDYHKIKNYVTVVGDNEKGRVNINTASPNVLEALILNKDEVDDVLQFRAGDDGEEGTEDDGYYVEGDADEDKNEEELPKKWNDDFKVSSDYFMITSTASIGEIKSKIVCILDRNSDKIIYGYEQ